ncbi:MAG TPA: glycosyltransferase [Pyrinomonadaceae bacterium]|nr:glycosyltransferase [Pyrinomonadaceae bacterium]
MDDAYDMSCAIIEPSIDESREKDYDLLPRLLYIGDVAVAATVAGSTQLYRLLQRYPRQILLIAEGNLWMSSPDKRLPHVKYEAFRVGSKRLLLTRFHATYSCLLYLTATTRKKQLEQTFAEFQPEAIFTVAHGYSWLTAAQMAKLYDLPLHLVIHDDWVSTQESVLPASVHRKLKRQFGEAYRQAASRLCVSPFMVEDFARKYGVGGTVLYPSRAADVPPYQSVPDSPRNERSLTFAFAGTVNTRGYAESLTQFAAVLEKVGGMLVVYSNLSADDRHSCGLTGRHITVRPILPIKELLASLREDVDALFVPMSFTAEDAQNMKVAFPSKLADYTIAGLPLLIWGPSYCSAVRWAQENAGVAEVVAAPDAETLEQSVLNLMTNEHYRRSLGENALLKGREFFAHEVAVEKFHQAVRQRTEKK